MQSSLQQKKYNGSLILPMHNCTWILY